MKLNKGLDENQERRVIICADRKFPHGDAGGNRIEYMAKCFLSQGIETFVVSLGENKAVEWIEERGVYLHDTIIPYYNAALSPGIRGMLEWYCISGKKVVALINGMVKKQDIIIIYTSNPIFAIQIRRGIRKEYNCKFIYDVVEWFDETCYAKGKLNPRYWVFHSCFYRVYPKADGILAISGNIEKHFKEEKCKTFLFPICFDAVPFQSVTAHRYDNKIRLIYPGNPQNKDDIKTMISAIDLLCDEEKKRIEFHLTAVSKETIRKLMGSEGFLLSKLKDIIIFHDWMEYEDLLRLYSSVDALYMLRLDNLVTRSNFPSKVPELMACGVVVIANDCGDFFKYLDDGKNAVLINDNSKAACLKALRHYIHLSDEERRNMSVSACRCARTKFDYKLYSRQLAEFVLNV